MSMPGSTSCTPTRDPITLIQDAACWAHVGRNFTTSRLQPTRRSITRDPSNRESVLYRRADPRSARDIRRESARLARVRCSTRYTVGFKVTLAQVSVNPTWPSRSVMRSSRGRRSTRFCPNGIIESTTMDRGALRAIALVRKNYLFAGSEGGGGGGGEGRWRRACRRQSNSLIGSKLSASIRKPTCVIHRTHATIPSPTRGKTPTVESSDLQADLAHRLAAYAATSTFVALAAYRGFIAFRRHISIVRMRRSSARPSPLTRHTNAGGPIEKPR